MAIKNLKLIGAISVISSALIFNACTPEEQALVTGVAVGAVVAAAVYDHPRYYGQPYYYYSGRYYYGGYYRDGYYYYKGKRFYNGHYYRDGYRYHRGKRHRARVGQYGYYKNRKQYEERHRYRNYR